MGLGLIFRILEILIGAEMSSQLWTTIGLVMDLFGAWFVAIEIIKKFNGPQTIDIGNVGALNGSFVPKPNPEYLAYEKIKHRWMAGGLLFLTLGFLMQIIGTWVSK